VSPLPIRPDRRAELERLFACPVEVVWARDLDALDAALAVPAAAVVLDAIAPGAAGLAAARCAGLVVLRPRRDEGRTSRGERVPVFAGYSTGDDALADGALGHLVARAARAEAAGDAALPPVA
jgi:hypothetical protein